jgi:hypothetical protein
MDASSGTTVDNLNVLDTSKTNDTSRTELSPFLRWRTRSSRVQTQRTIDGALWLGPLRLTLSINGNYFTLRGATASDGTHGVQIAQIDSLGT